MNHQHGPNCGHAAVRHRDHVDYLQDGRLVHSIGGHEEDHKVEVTDQNPDRCTHEVHGDGHRHGPGCGHEAVPHGDHIDYLVNGRLHHPHDEHCDDHGPLDSA